MPANLPEQVASILARHEERIQERLGEWEQIETPAEFSAFQLELQAMSRETDDLVAAAVLIGRLADPAFQTRAVAAAQMAGGRKLRSGGAREVSVTLLGGTTIRVTVPYLKPDRRKRPGRKRKSGRRGKGGVGLYPTLAALGIWFGVSPALAGEIARQVADSDSVRSARAALARRGIDLGHKQTLRVVNHVSHRMVGQRQRWFEHVLRANRRTGGPLAGRRVVIGTDGGRCRMRIPARCGRRRKKTRHRGYQTPWQEPKVLVIYILDARGRIDHAFRPVYDATMGDCNAVFSMLVAYLRALGGHLAQQLVVVGDGAKWIWERVAELAAAVGIKSHKVVEVLDWYHAVETLHEISRIPARWGKTRRKQWMKRAVRLLRAGDIDGVVQHIESLAVGRRAKKVSAHIPYFTRNAHRMQYKRFRALKIPLGSGAIESAVRRIVNLRLKSVSKFWLEANAEGMLLLRSYLKAGRFDDLYEWSLRAAVPWWIDAVGDPVTQPAVAESQPSQEHRLAA